MSSLSNHYIYYEVVYCKFIPYFLWVDLVPRKISKLAIYKKWGDDVSTNLSVQTKQNKERNKKTIYKLNPQSNQTKIEKLEDDGLT